MIMKKNLLSIILLAFVVLLAACKKDNYKALSSTITGRVVYQGQPVGVRSNGVQLELWQHGYQLFSKIPVYIAQDGTFSALVGDGDYKLVRLKGNGPWADNTADSIDVHVSGTVNVDVPVDPYFIIKSASFQKNGGAVVATFTIQRVNTTKALELVRLDVGKTIITDVNNSAANAQMQAAAITDPTQPLTLNVAIPADLAGKDYVFARVGVKTSGVSELVYSQPQKVALK
jgi:Protein of unknown function (DUF3823) N-terminal domain/Domain of unknown function (DUF3823_C)